MLLSDNREGRSFYIREAWHWNTFYLKVVFLCVVGSQKIEKEWCGFDCPSYDFTLHFVPFSLAGFMYRFLCCLPGFVVLFSERLHFIWKSEGAFRYYVLSRFSTCMILWLSAQMIRCLLTFVEAGAFAILSFIICVVVKALSIIWLKFVFVIRKITQRLNSAFRVN